jgi:hypothetical protein
MARFLDGPLCDTIEKPPVFFRRRPRRIYVGTCGDGPELYPERVGQACELVCLRKRADREHRRIPYPLTVEFADGFRGITCWDALRVADVPPEPWRQRASRTRPALVLS